MYVFRNIYTQTEPLCLRNMLVQACQNHGSKAGHPSCLVLTLLLGNIIMEHFPFRCLFDDPQNVPPPVVRGRNALTSAL